MKVQGVKKLPGCGVIEVDREVHGFIIGDESQAEYSDFELMLSETPVG